MSDATRKAVVTTAQVQAALTQYTQTLSSVSGLPVEGLEFDKGARGKGFAVYNGQGAVVDTFETKEEAYVKFTNWHTVASQVLSLIAERALREQAEADAAKTAKTTKAPQKVAA